MRQIIGRCRLNVATYMGETRLGICIKIQLTQHSSRTLLNGLLAENAAMTFILACLMSVSFFWARQLIDAVANTVVAQLLHLESADPDKDISLYINSPGGSVSAGLAIYDTMQYIKCDVSTICMGMAASMGSVLLCAGAPGKRIILPNAQVMIHQHGWLR